MRLLPFSVSRLRLRGPDVARRDHSALDHALSGWVAGEPERCVPARMSPGPEVASDQRLLCRSGWMVWVNPLRDACLGLRPISTQIVEMNGLQYCRGDQVLVVVPGDAAPGPSRALGEFVTYRHPNGS